MKWKQRYSLNNNTLNVTIIWWSTICFIILVSTHHSPHQNFITRDWGECWQRVAKGMPSQIWQWIASRKQGQNENKCHRLFDPTFAHIHATTNSKPRLLRSRGVEFPTPRGGGPFVYLPNVFATQHGIKILASSSSRTPRQQPVRHPEQQQQQQQQQLQQEQEQKQQHHHQQQQAANNKMIKHRTTQTRSNRRGQQFVCATDIYIKGRPPSQFCKIAGTTKIS